MKKQFRFRPATYTNEKIVEEFGIEIFWTLVPYPAVIGYSGKSNKSRFHFRYRNEKELLEKVDQFINNISRIETQKKERSLKMKELQSGLKAENYFKVGDIIVNTWGLEQKKVEFYQVIELKNKKIVVRKLKKKSSKKEGYSSMSTFVTPDINNFIESEKPLLLSLKMDGENTCRIVNPERYYYFHKWDNKPEYCSWYY